ncbi:MAG: prolipoprotein diacylglyceryl transferase [Oscillospiraceae bacterium]|jgi:phosphatidylglycerol:prolipoprotein diacylglycerol transferase|nr:prolipoprotein diacylglyceryl transferase [Oscillospiraceae bacterium]
MEIAQSMPGATITFPMLGDGFAIGPSNTYSLWGLELHWYGAIIALGFLLAYLYVNRRSKAFGLTQDNIIDMLLCAVPAAVVGSRLYYVVFNYALFRGDFWSIFKIWEGGLAIYGVVIGAVLAVWIYCRVKKLPIGPFLDIGGLGLLIGQTIGRWANFINREAFGGETDIFCRMGLTDASGNTVYVHPTFLYESVWNLLGLLLLHLFSKSGKRRYDGQLFVMYLAWYGFGRIFIEGLRTDSLYLFGTGLRVSQLLAGISCFAALVFLAINGSIPHDPDKLLMNTAAAEGMEAAAPEEEKD